MKYNYKYNILFKFDPSMDMILNAPYGWRTILNLFYDYTREYKQGDKIDFTYTKGKNKKLLDWYNNNR